MDGALPARTRAEMGFKGGQEPQTDREREKKRKTLAQLQKRQLDRSKRLTQHRNIILDTSQSQTPFFFVLH